MTATFRRYSKNTQAPEISYFSPLLNANLNGNFRLGSLNGILATFQLFIRMLGGLSMSINYIFPLVLLKKFKYLQLFSFDTLMATTRPNNGCEVDFFKVL